MTATSSINVKFPLTANELMRWSKFAQTKGGIGKCRAVVDKMSDSERDLMFLESDEITVLACLEKESYLGWCEGVVGCFSKDDVVFTTKLKRPVLSPKLPPAIPSVPPVPSSFPPLPSSPTSSNNSHARHQEPSRPDRQPSTDLASPVAQSPTRNERTTASEAEEIIPKRRERTTSSSSDSSAKSRRRMGLAILTAKDGGEFGDMPQWDERLPLWQAGSPTASPKTSSTANTTPQLDFSTSPDPSSDSGHEVLTPPMPQWAPPTPTSPRTHSTTTPFSPHRKPVAPNSVPSRVQSLSSPTSVSSRRGPDQKESSSPTPAPSNRPLRSQFSDVSLADSRFSRSTGTKFSEGPSMGEDEMPVFRSAFSPYSPGSSVGSSMPDRRRLQSMDSNWSRSRSEKEGVLGGEADEDEQDEGDRTTSTFGPPPGEVTEQLFSQIFDLYSTTTPAGSSNPGSSLNSIASTPAPVSPSPYSMPNSGMKLREPAFDGPLVEEPENFEGEEEEPSSATVESIATELRERLTVAALEKPRGSANESMDDSFPSEQETTRTSIAIPRLSSIFPRSSHDDSTYLPSAHSSRSPSPEEPINPSRRLFQDYVSPSRTHAPKFLVGRSDMPSPPITTFSVIPPPRTTSEAQSKLNISAPTLMSAPPLAAWRSRDTLPKRLASVETGMRNIGSPTSPSSPPKLVSSEAGGIPTSVSFYDDPNAPPLRTWMPKLTIPSDNPHTGIDYSLRVPASPQAHSNYSSSNPPSFNMSNSGQNSPASDSTTYSVAPPPPTTLPRSQSVGSLRDGPAKLRKNNLRIKTSEALLKAGMTEAAITMTGSASFSSATDLESMRFQAQRAGPQTPPTTTDSEFGSPVSSIGMVKSQSMFNFTRKTSQTKEAKPKPNYGAPVSSKDFEEETVKVKGGAEFELVKPMAALLLKDGEPSSTSHVSRPSVSSVPSHDHGIMDSDADSDEEDDDVATRIGNLLYSPSRDKFDIGRSTLSLPDQQHQPSSVPSLPPSDEKTVENHRAKELTWVKTLSLSAPSVKKSRKVKALVQAGIPSSVRGRVWSFLAEAHVDKVEGLYHSLASMDQPRPGLESEVARTVHNNPQFSRHETMWDDLLSVVRALAFYDSELNRYDSLAAVASLLLTQVPAEETFYIMVALVRRYNLHVFCSTPTPKLAMECIAFQIILEGMQPKLAAHLAAQGVDARTFLPCWQSTLFTDILPHSTRLRIADLVFFDPTFILRTSLAVMELALPRLMEINSHDATVRYLLNIPQATLVSSLLLPTVFTIKLKEDRVKKAYKKAESTLIKSGVMRNMRR